MGQHHWFKLSMMITECMLPALTGFIFLPLPFSSSAKSPQSFLHPSDGQNVTLMRGETCASSDEKDVATSGYSLALRCIFYELCH